MNRLVDRLQQLTTQATALVQQEREGGVGESAARARRRALRRDIDHQLRHLARDAVGAFNASSATADTGRLDHIGAHADFNAVAREIMELVRLIDGLNTVRLKDQPKLLAEWQAAKNVFGSVRAKVDEPADAAPATPGATEAAA